MTDRKPLDLGKALETTRKNRDLSKAAAARSIEVTRLTYDMWERGAWVPDVERTDQIAKFLDVPRMQVLEALLRMNGLIDYDHYLELKGY